MHKAGPRRCSEGLWSGAPDEPVEVCKVNGVGDCWVNCDALSMALEEGGHRGNATLGNGLARALTPLIYPLAMQ